MEYNLKEKIEITTSFVEELISKSWQDAEAIQHQIANLDTSTELGREVVKLLKNMCTSHYVLIGCLETLIDSPEKFTATTADQDNTAANEQIVISNKPGSTPTVAVEASNELTDRTSFEPFEYFVEFDEPVGVPLSDEDLYG